MTQMEAVLHRAWYIDGGLSFGNNLGYLYEHMYPSTPMRYAPFCKYVHEHAHCSDSLAGLL